MSDFLSTPSRFFVDLATRWCHAVQSPLDPSPIPRCRLQKRTSKKRSRDAWQRGSTAAKLGIVEWVRDPPLAQVIMTFGWTVKDVRRRFSQDRTHKGAVGGHKFWGDPKGRKGYPYLWNRNEPSHREDADIFSDSGCIISHAHYVLAHQDNEKRVHSA